MNKIEAKELEMRIRDGEFTLAEEARNEALCNALVDFGNEYGINGDAFCDAIMDTVYDCVVDCLEYDVVEV